MKRKKDSKSERTLFEWTAGLLLIGFAALAFIALIGFHHYDWPAGGHVGEIQNPLKQLGAGISFILIHFFFGRWGAFIFPFLALIWGLKSIAGIGKPVIPSVLLVCWGLFSGWSIHLMSKYYELLLPEYYWGMMSGRIADFIETFTGFTGAWIITAVVLLILLRMTITNRVWRGAGALIWGLGSRIFAGKEKSSGSDARRRKWQTFEEKSGGGGDDSKDAKKAAKSKKKESRKLKKDKQKGGEEGGDQTIADAGKDKKGIPEEYVFPETSFLQEPENGKEVSQDDLRNSAVSLEERLNEFGVEAKVVGIHPGPVITRFDLQPAPGVKVSKIVNLQDDLALSMRARSLRILAPIPGEAAVGIEIPNSEARLVRLRTILESPAFKKSKSLLTLALGLDTSGDPYVADLQQMPHLLVAGTTGSGKSVCLNTILASILFRAKPEEVRVALIDPKKLELSLYVPLLEHHLITPPGVREPVITEPDSAMKMLKSLELEMQLRYTKLSQGGYRSMEEYNLQRDVSRLPYIVLVIDELADLMMTAGSAIESPIARLAQMGRAVGIHLIVATQRPSVDVLTGVIKANFPCRIAFQVASKVDSRTILDANGAETLLGKGDMLFLPPGLGIAQRIHGSMIDGREIETIVQHISEQPVSEERAELPDPMVEDHRVLNLSPTDRDELFAEAAKLIAIHQQGSVSLLQRKLKIGYARAARIIDQMEAVGIVGPFDGSKARKVMVPEDWLPEMGAPGEVES